MEVVYLTKMSVKGLGCKPATDSDKPKLLCHIYGKADGIKVGESKDGRAWSCLTGTFEGKNLATGEVYRSGKLFLPSGIHETIETAVNHIKKEEVESTLAVKFALEIRSVQATNPVGYSYQAVNLMKVEASDDLSELRKAISEARAEKALPAAAESGNGKKK